MGGMPTHSTACKHCGCAGSVCRRCAYLWGLRCQDPTHQVGREEYVGQADNTHVERPVAVAPHTKHSLCGGPPRYRSRAASGGPRLSGQRCVAMRGRMRGSRARCIGLLLGRQAGNQTGSR
jgi:hypothetical protein